jgi:hypothetical protein
MGRSDTPPPSWYEPPDPIEDEEPEPDWPDEALHVLADCIVWQCIPGDDD